MKSNLLVALLVMLAIQNNAQTYLNIKFSDNSYKYAAISDITEITFNGAGTEMTITLSSGSSTETISGITEVTYNATILGGGSPLPVELTSFTSNLVDGTVELNWTTATEVDNYGFEVQRKKEKVESWEEIGFVEGAGNSNSPKEYSFTDNLTPTHTLNHTLEYRLKQIDTDGSYEYSDVVNVELGVPENYELKQNYPNPFNPTTTISYQLPVKSFTTLKVYDILGKEVASLVNEEKEAGKYSVNFDGSSLTSGVYFSRLTAGSYTALIKMLMVK